MNEWILTIVLLRRNSIRTLNENWVVWFAIHFPFYPIPTRNVDKISFLALPVYCLPTVSIYNKWRHVFKFGREQQFDISILGHDAAYDNNFSWYGNVTIPNFSPFSPGSNKATENIVLLYRSMQHYSHGSLLTYTLLIMQPLS